ncbi:MAG: serine/threonine-protein kinase, partial [Vicinamibacteria bacterium]
PEDSKTDIRSPDETAVRPAESRPDPTERFTPGTLLAGRYRIISPLGKGGMGEVYRADDIRLGQPVALKFLPGALAADPGRLEKLVDEVRIGRQISHPNVCRLYDIAEADGHHFLVMEYVDGEDLASLLRRIGPIAGAKAIEIARGICAGLAAAHEKGIIHRDLKPANVMIDGLGHARIADFGLAALAHGGEARDMSGTPQYMAPEQLTGAGASTRSDVYALGLVLHEMLTGKRVFEAKSLSELRALHAETKPPSLSISAIDVDPGLDRVIQRCLSRDPADRPASAREVLLALPGGDPLQAAVLAGETPSPEMVAAATKVGDLSPRVAWTCLIAALLGLFLVTVLVGRATLFGRVPMPKSPDALVERAKEVLARLGYAEPAVDRAYGFAAVDEAFFDYLRRDPSPDRWKKLGTARPGPVFFYYRQSPSPLLARSWTVGPLPDPIDELGRVTRDQPPANVPGMAEVVVDPDGHLVSLRVVSRVLESHDTQWPDPGWAVLLAEAGFDPAALRSTPPRWSPPVASDAKEAWEGSYPGQPDVPMYIEAAAFHGRPVWFDVKGPWDLAPAGPVAESSGVAIGTTLTLIALVAIVFAGAVLVRRNVRMGRGDRRGAFRLAAFVFLTFSISLVLRADHTLVVAHEFAQLILLAAMSLYVAVNVWFYYIAMEPAVRRRWPNMLISWSRLLAGRFTDPLVGRDVLLGGLAGVSIALTLFLSVPMSTWFGDGSTLYVGAPDTTGARVLSSLSAPGHLAHFFFRGPSFAVVYALVLAFMLYLLQIVVRGLWPARVLLFIAVVLFFLGAWAPPALIAAIAVGIFTTVLVRLGLLSTAITYFVWQMLIRSPLTLDGSAWYAGRSFAVLGFFALMFIAAFYTSLGGKPLLGKALIED